MIPVDRGAGRAALSAMTARVRDALADGRQIIIFPEGTRRPAGAAPQYKFGVAFLYADCDAPCVPIALNSGLYWPRRRFLRFPGKVRVEVLDPILPGLDRKAFFTELEQKLEAATARLIAEGLRELGDAGRAHYEAAQSRPDSRARSGYGAFRIGIPAAEVESTRQSSRRGLPSKLHGAAPDGSRNRLSGLVPSRPPGSRAGRVRRAQAVGESAMYRASTILVLASLTFASFAIGGALAAPAAAATLQPGRARDDGRRAALDQRLPQPPRSRPCARRDPCVEPARGVAGSGKLRRLCRVHRRNHRRQSRQGGRTDRQDSAAAARRTIGRWCAASPIRARRDGRTCSPASPTGCRAAG